MSWKRRLAVLATIAAGTVCTLSCVDRNPPPTTPTDQSQDSDEFVDPFPEVDLSDESLDEVRRAELRRRAIWPVGDPTRNYESNYDDFLKGLQGGGKRIKPAEVMPATLCRSVEPVPKDTGPRDGPHGAHYSTLLWFGNASGFGYTRMAVSMNRHGKFASSKDIDRVELVSLLTAVEPRAYVLDLMATPVLARRAKRRPLDEFERLGLDAVRKGEVLVWTREAPKRMFGAIRAKADCLDCHSKAKEGDLLGAFTYYLDVPVDQVKR